MADVDIGEELLKAVRADFRKELGDNDSKLAKILKRIQNGKGTMHDAAFFSGSFWQSYSWPSPSK